jgi:hypothetical protein
MLMIFTPSISQTPSLFALYQFPHPNPENREKSPEFNNGFDRNLGSEFLFEILFLSPFGVG